MLVLVLNRHLNTAEEVMNLMRKALTRATREESGDNQPFAILIIADEFTPEALRQLVVHRQPAQIDPRTGKNVGGDGLNIVAVRAPLFKDARRDLLEDICLLTKATRIENPAGKNYENLSPSVFGIAERVTVTQQKTIVTAGTSESVYRTSTIDPYLARLKAMSEDTSLRTEEISALKSRLAALTGGVAVIKVGGTSVNEVEKLKFQVLETVKKKCEAYEYLIDRTFLAVQSYIYNGGNPTVGYRCAFLLLGRYLPAGASTQDKLVELLRPTLKQTVNACIRFLQKQVPQLPPLANQRNDESRERMAEARINQIGKT